VNIPDSVDVGLDDESSGAAAANGVTLVSRLRPRTYRVRLAIRGSNCSAVGGDEITVDVATRSVTPVRFELVCTAPVRSAKIVFVVDTTNRGAPETLIEVIDPDGSGARMIGRGRAPAWSPDGTRVAFSDARCGANDDGGFGCFGGVLVVDPELGSLTRPANGDQGFSPAWSPARDTIAFVGCCDVAAEPTRLFVAGLGESPVRELVLPAARLIEHPTWSPDGKRIAFTCAGTGSLPGQPPNGDLCIVGVDGSDFSRLTTTVASESDPAWSPDGKRIAFTLGTQVALLELADGLVTPLTEGQEPAWSPDGSMLVFAGSDGLFTIQADGSKRQRLTTGPHRTPAWRP
jgi:Tol biopolymer transport system component